jgi:hypothetical protein
VRYPAFRAGIPTTPKAIGSATSHAATRTTIGNVSRPSGAGGAANGGGATTGGLAITAVPDTAPSPAVATERERRRGTGGAALAPDGAAAARPRAPGGTFST